MSPDRRSRVPDASQPPPRAFFGPQGNPQLEGSWSSWRIKVDHASITTTAIAQVTCVIRSSRDAWRFACESQLTCLSFTPIKNKLHDRSRGSVHF